MNAGHTPGPWSLVEFGGPQISGPDGYAVCTMWGGLSADKLAGQDAANAHLIAAAPDLLDLAYQYRNDLQYPVAPDSRERRLKAIDVAIAKATAA